MGWTKVDIDFSKYNDFYDAYPTWELATFRGVNYIFDRDLEKIKNVAIKLNGLHRIKLVDLVGYTDPFSVIHVVPDLNSLDNRLLFELPKSGTPTLEVNTSSEYYKINADSIEINTNQWISFFPQRENNTLGDSVWSIEKLESDFILPGKKTLVPTQTLSHDGKLITLIKK